MPPKRLKRNIGGLQLLANAKKQQRNAFINTASKDQIECLCDCANNFLKGNIPFSEAEVRKLKRYQKQIRFLANKDNNDIEGKRKILVQYGGFLPALLTPILSVAGLLLADLLKK